MATIKTIYTTNYNEEDYLDAFLEENNLTKEKYKEDERIWSPNFCEFCNTEKEIEFGDELSNIACFESNHGEKTYIIKAVIGRWDGLAEGGKILIGMGTVIAACIDDDFSIYLKGNK